jgi:hypothetical protein
LNFYFLIPSLNEAKEKNSIISVLIALASFLKNAFQISNTIPVLEEKRPAWEKVGAAVATLSIFMSNLLINWFGLYVMDGFFTLACFLVFFIYGYFQYKYSDETNYSYYS